MDDRGRTSRWGGLLALIALVALLSGGGLWIAFDDDGDGRPDRGVKVLGSTKVDGGDGDAKPDEVVSLDRTAVAVRKDFEAHPRDLTPEKSGVPALSGSGPQRKVGKVPGPLATAHIPGCRTRFLSTNFSSRGVPQSAVRSFDLHFTAGPDIPGTRSEVDGLTAYGNRPSSRVSWHFNLDKDGNCDYNVPLSMKSWTIGNKNPPSINVEVHGRGEAPYLRPAGYRQLARIYRAVRQAGYKIPLRVGRSVNCRVVVSGFDTHWRSGPCSGGHTDIKPHDIAAVVRRLRGASGHPPRTARQKKRCGALRHHRTLVRKGRGSWKDELTVHGKKTTRQRRARYLRTQLRGGGVNTGLCR